MKSFQAAQTSFRVKQSEKTTIELVLGESYFFQPSFCYLMPGSGSICLAIYGFQQAHQGVWLDVQQVA
jgi:hypothetical protein